MKLLNIILSLYIVLLTAYPCADEHVAVFESSSQAQNSSQHDHSHEKEMDACSPFCVCNCCGVSTLTFLEVASFQFLVPFEEIRSTISFYKSNSFSNFYGSIWQPPQLV